MRDVQMNLLMQQRWQPWRGLLLVLLIVLAVILIVNIRQLETNVEPKAIPQVLVVEHREPVVDTLGNALITKADAEIAIPWLLLLKGLESIQSNDIIWMTLAPDQRRQRVQIRFMTPDRANGWAYLQRLKTLPMLKQIKLHSSSIVEQDEMPMVAFEVEAKWQF